MATEWVKDLVAQLNGPRKAETEVGAERDEFLAEALGRFKRVLLIAEEAVRLLDEGVDDFSLTLTDSERSSPGSLQITLRVTGQKGSRRADLVVSSVVKEAEPGEAVELVE